MNGKSFSSTPKALHDKNVGTASFDMPVLLALYGKSR